MKTIDLIGKNITVLPSYIDTFNAEILDTNGTYFILKITEIPKHSSQKTHKVGDNVYFNTISNFKIN